MIAVKATEGVPFPPFGEETTVAAVAIQSIWLESVLALCKQETRDDTFRETGSGRQLSGSHPEG